MISLESYNEIILDRDGIINEVIIRNGKVSSPRNLNEFHLRNEFIKFKEKFKGKNFYIASNQPDIARKLMSKSELQEIDNFISSELEIDKIYYCMHDDRDSCNCRKPKPGLLEKIVQENNLNKDECVFIGDSVRDVEAAIKASIAPIFLVTPYNQLPLSLEYKHIYSLDELWKTM